MQLYSRSIDAKNLLRIKNRMAKLDGGKADVENLFFKEADCP
jgi:hypothetical protein